MCLAEVSTLISWLYVDIDEAFSAPSWIRAHLHLKSSTVPGFLKGNSTRLVALHWAKSAEMNVEQRLLPVKNLARIERNQHNSLPSMVLRRRLVCRTKVA